MSSVIWIDDREDDKRVQALRRRLKILRLPFIQQRLVGADADMCNKYARVEVKELKDMWQAVFINKRYWEQLYNHIITDQRPYLLLIYGDVEEARTKLKPYVGRKLTKAKIVEGMAEIFARGAGIDIVFVEDMRDAVYLAYKFLQYCAEGKWGLPKNKQLKAWERKKMGRPTPSELKVMRVFNVSKNVASNLLRKFKTLKGIIMANKHELLTVDGVGEVTARKITGVK